MWWLLLLAGVVGVGRLVKDALKHSRHVFHDECITPAAVQDDLRHVLLAFHTAATEQGLTWWLDYGTLLGAWRLGDILAFDHDADVGYLASEKELLAACAPTLATFGVTLNADRGTLYYGGRKLCDIDPWWPSGDVLVRGPRPSNPLLRFLEAWHNDFPSAWLAPRWRIRFLGRWFPCMNHPARRLLRLYPTCRLHLRLCIPHRQRCWVCPDFYREAWRIWRSRAGPVLERGA